MTVSLKGLSLQYSNRPDDNQQAGWRIPSHWKGVQGGVSSTAFGPLAWGRGEASDTARNRRKWSEHEGFACEQAVTLDQIHGAAILRAKSEHQCAGFLKPQTRISDTDGLVTNESRVVLVTSHADCAPLFLYSEEGRAIALVHAGWRGTISGIAGEAVRKMQNEFSLSPSKLRVAIGPMIDTRNYPVGEEIAERFTQSFGPQVIADFMHRPHLDLFAALTVDLLRAGIQEQNLGERPPSTFTESRWSSYRRDGTQAGGMLAYFMLT